MGAGSDFWCLSTTDDDSGTVYFAQMSSITGNAIWYSDGGATEHPNAKIEVVTATGDEIGECDICHLKYHLDELNYCTCTKWVCNGCKSGPHTGQDCI